MWHWPDDVVAAPLLVATASTTGCDMYMTMLFALLLLLPFPFELPIPLLLLAAFHALSPAGPSM